MPQWKSTDAEHLLPKAQQILFSWQWEGFHSKHKSFSSAVEKKAGVAVRELFLWCTRECECVCV